CYSRGNWL
ncbi:ydfX domain protein, partial [Escherichia coli EC96038]